jgi:hypothetical protein
MGHYISGLIARAQTFERFCERYSLEPAVRLMRNVCFLPLDDRNLDTIPGLTFATPSESGFRYLVPSLLALLKDFSIHGDLVYIETEYHGGTGSQGAVLLRNGTVAFGPTSSDYSQINLALRELGIKLSPAIKIASRMRLRSRLFRHLLERCRAPYLPFDEFEAIGLADCRSNDAFRATRPQGIL